MLSRYAPWWVVLGRLKVVPKDCHGKILTNGSLTRGHGTAMNCGSSVVGLLRSGGFPNIQWETRSGSIMWESLFATLTVPRSKGLSRAFFFILVLLNLPSTELSVLSVTRLRLRSRFPVWGARVAQWWEHSPPTNVARVQIPASTPYVGWVCCWFSPLLRVPPGTLVFPSPQKPTFPNSNSTRNQVDEEPLCGCATCKSLFISCIYLSLKKIPMPRIKWEIRA